MADRFAAVERRACKSLGLLHASTPGIQILVECSLDKAMREWRLEPATRADAHFWIAKARFPLSVFGGAVLCGKRTDVDALQAALYRTQDKRPKDMAYVYDVILLSQNEWATARRIVAEVTARGGEHAVWLAKALKKLRLLFASPAADGVVEARHVLAAAAMEQPPSAIAICAVTQEWLAKCGNPRKRAKLAAKKVTTSSRRGMRSA